ncbi:serine protease, partial [Frankia sp. R82]|uniref:trypsin-like serine peptidase n=1 Tax=Frankia sp. R82 TaxID=2950553 RepID=UPI0020447DA6
APVLAGSASGSPPAEIAGGAAVTPGPLSTAAVPSAAGAMTPAEQAEVARYWTTTRRDRAFGSHSGGRSDEDDTTAAPTVTPAAAETGAGPTGAPPALSNGAPYRGGGLVTSTTGRLFTTIDGSDFACSASVVTSPGRDMVVTAGHCLHGGAGSSFARNVVFVPGYANGAMPYGIWVARHLSVTTGWAQRGDFDVDAGFALFNPRDGRRLQDVVGAQDIAFDLPATVEQYSFGYPRLTPFDGTRLIYCASPVATDPYGGPSIGIRCRMTAGASGGPFLTGLGRLGPGHGWIDGVVSYAYAGSTDRLYGTRFGAEVRALYLRTAQV